MKKVEVVNALRNTGTYPNAFKSNVRRVVESYQEQGYELESSSITGEQDTLVAILIFAPVMGRAVSDD